MPASDFKYTLRLKIYKEEKFFGEGVCSLLANVCETHSLLQASKSMSMAYTKALQIIRRAEDNLEYKLLIRQTGGASGGGSHLTSNAIELLKAYRQFESDVALYTDKQFEILTKKMDQLK